MAPRRYELGQRAVSMAATRARIVDATVALHSEQGILATSYADIARRAGVGVGSVYHHFPVIDDLVQACGGRIMEITQPPTREAFASIRSRSARVSRLVAELFGWYERYPQWRRALCDADKLEALARGAARRDDHVRDLVVTALGPSADPASVATVRALVDFEVYRHLVEDGRTTGEAARVIAEVLIAWLGRRGTHRPRSALGSVP